MTEVTLAGRDPTSAGVYSGVPPMPLCVSLPVLLRALNFMNRGMKYQPGKEKVNPIEDEFKMNQNRRIA